MISDHGLKGLVFLLDMVAARQKGARLFVHEGCGGIAKWEESPDGNINCRCGKCGIEIREGEENEDRPD